MNIIFFIIYGLFLSVLIRFLGTFWECFLGFSGGGEEQKPKSKIKRLDAG
jgi:hypothetical protein